MQNSDYTPGDPPVRKDVEVEYRDSRWQVEDHMPPPDDVPDPDVHYPDGVAYILWPLGVPKKFGNRDQSMMRVRRRSFRIIRGE